MLANVWGASRAVTLAMVRVVPLLTAIEEQKPEGTLLYL
jgi:hypothetical protein